jgi:hypothetical protein
MISSGGAASTSHYRSHVRKKEAVEIKRGDKLFFAKSDFSIIDTEPYAKIGMEPLPGQPKEVWDITEALKELVAIDPASYYITSGEAVNKAEKLVQDTSSLAAKCRSFRDKLKIMRGVKKYLETQHEGMGQQSRLLVKTKMPRDRSPKEEK